jgi:hypothetical protein
LTGMQDFIPRYIRVFVPFVVKQIDFDPDPDFDFDMEESLKETVQIIQGWR